MHHTFLVHRETHETKTNKRPNTTFGSSLSWLFYQGHVWDMRGRRAEQASEADKQCRQKKRKKKPAGNTRAFHMGMYSSSKRNYAKTGSRKLSREPLLYFLYSRHSGVPLFYKARCYLYTPMAVKLNIYGGIQHTDGDKQHTNVGKSCATSTKERRKNKEIKKWGIVKPQNSQDINLTTKPHNHAPKTSGQEKKRQAKR